MNDNDDKKKFGALPVSIEVYEMVKQRQVELIAKRGKALSLTKIVNEIVKKGIKLIDEENGLSVRDGDES